MHVLWSLCLSVFKWTVNNIFKVQLKSINQLYNKVVLSDLTQAHSYCKEGTEMRQLVFRSADVYCQIVNNLYLRNIVILY